MKPSFLFIANCYPLALEHFKITEADKKSYEECDAELSQKLPEIGHLYSLNLNKLGYKANAIISNHETLQKKWAEENGINFSGLSIPHLARQSYFLRSVISKFPKVYYSLRNLIDKKTWDWQILMAQIKKFKPDILQIFDLHYFTPLFLKEARKYAKKIIGETSSPIIMPEEHLKCYDLLLSSLPHYLERFKNMGIPAFYLPYAFELEILEKIGKDEQKYDCVFVGGLGKYSEEFFLLEELAKRVNIDFWGYINPPLDSLSPVLAKYHGQTWGMEMFKIYAQSKIVINRHIKKIGKYYSNEKYANNMRLYEATGMGAMLITDAKENLGELFEAGKEVETYSSLEELIAKIKYYLQHDREREKIALAGQERTLRDHTFKVRAKKLLEIVKYGFN